MGFKHLCSQAISFFICMEIVLFIVGSWGSAPDPGVRAYSPPPYPLAGQPAPSLGLSPASDLCPTIHTCIILVSPLVGQLSVLITCFAPPSPQHTTWLRACLASPSYCDEIVILFSYNWHDFLWYARRY